MQSGGRVYGLAVALGMGAAIAAGHGVAYADSGADAGTASSPASSDTTSAADHQPKTPAKRHRDETRTTKRAPARSAPSQQAPDPAGEPETATAATDAVVASQDANAAPERPRTRGHRARRDAATTTDPAPRPRARVTPSPAAAPATPGDAVTETPAQTDAGPASVPPAATTTVTVEVPAEPDATPQPTNPPAETVTATVARANLDRTDRLADDGPTTPAETALLGVLAGFARQETQRSTRTHLISVDAVGTALVDDDAPAPATVDAAATDDLPVEQTRVPVVTARVAPFEFLQHIPLIGPLIVTPIVALIHQIPFVSDLIHPWIGYPVDHNAPAGSAPTRDVYMTSWDGVRINVHFMPAEGLQVGQTAPTVLYGPGLPMPGATNIDGTLLDGVLVDMLGMVGIDELRAAGYNVVTWDPRGEYLSRGQMQIDSPDFEARDVSAIISWVSSLPEAQLDSADALDPRIGMVGVSYGGGIQLVTAGIDKRVDAIVPTIAWNSLNTSLNKSGAPKTSWATLLTAVIILTGGRPNPQIYAAVLHGALTGELTQADTYFLTDRSAGALSADKITVPTLLIQGTVDTLFSLQETDAIAQVLLDNGVTTKVLWFCGGHGLCTNNPWDASDGRMIEARTLEWLNRYVKGDTSVSTGPAFEWVDQRGQWFSSDTYQLPQADPIVVSGGAGEVLHLLPIAAGSGSLPLLPWAAKARNAINVTIPAATTTTYIVGAPQLTLTYSGTGSSKFVYAQLVDDSTGLVLGTQITPVPVVLDNQTHTVTVTLESVAATLAPGQTATLQLVAESGTYVDLLPSVGELFSNGKLTVENIQVTLPTVDAAAIAGDAPPLATAV